MEKIILITLVILVLLSGSGCLDYISEVEGDSNENNSLAPGCEEPKGIFPQTTGCLGKSGIKDISVEPTIECLELRANNCNGGVLGISNNCNFDLQIDDVIISPDTYKNIELTRNKDGKVVVVEPKGNFDSYNPQNEELLDVSATLGDQIITISYLKKNVCGREKTPNIPMNEDEDIWQ